ncbi:hypothetical protein M8C21_003247 [Ambrosia artemisiifolia]|uniref:Uncharacterized protein n=1 Tax=Ambrosia artemisiifolia TaxID=4212 RepID=A0AAD5CJR5_AMBAR|nr:hypothetical protein M8C21_003247 [Ambrosia artemisiifolia]
MEPPRISALKPKEEASAIDVRIPRKWIPDF